MKNNHSLLIPADIVSQAQTLVDQAITLLLPYVTSLTPSERHKIPKMGAKTLSFVEKSHDFSVHNPALCPPYLDMDAFDIDFEDAHNLWTLLLSTKQLQEIVDDTEMVAGSEAYQSALVFYNYIKVAARQDVPRAKAEYEELKKRFPGGRHKTDKNESDTVTEII
jgi:hypothetical protein